MTIFKPYWCVGILEVQKKYSPDDKGSQKNE